MVHDDPFIYLEHSCDIAGAEDPLHAGVSLGIRCREVRSEDAVLGALPALVLARGAPFARAAAGGGFRVCARRHDLAQDFAERGREYFCKILQREGEKICWEILRILQRYTGSCERCCVLCIAWGERIWKSSTAKFHAGKENKYGKWQRLSIYHAWKARKENCCCRKKIGAWSPSAHRIRRSGSFRRQPSAPA